MHYTTLKLLGLVALTTALPTATILEPVGVRIAHPLRTLPVERPVSFEIRALLPLQDARAATIFKSPDASGESTFIPANNYCTNISVVPGGFDSKIRSLSVEKGRKCDFYQEEGCNINDFTGGGAVLEVGSYKYKDVRRQLGSWDGKIASVYCQQL